MEFPTGAIPDPPEVVAMLEKRVLPRVHFLPEELPDSIDLSSGLPPVGTQVGPSCVGWAIGYNHKTYDEFYEFGWAVTQWNHQFSANYIYNQIKIPDGGASPYYAYQTLVDQGCCSRTNFPATDDTTPVTQTHKEYAKPYRITTFGTMPPSRMHEWREVLANGRMMTIIIRWSSDCRMPETTNHIIYDPIGYISNHQVCICGYDQNINGTGVSGFRFVNSHGTRYADGGFAWLSEEFLTADWCSAYWMTDKTTPPSNLRAVDMNLVWDGPSDITYEIHDETSATIDTTTSTMYGPVEPGTYGVGALGSECLETIVVEDCQIANCMFEVE